MMASWIAVIALTAGLALMGVALAAQPQPSALRVCSDPNNLPFSNQDGQGFENRIAELLGRALGMPVEYTWWPQRRGFIRNTVDAGKCDVVMGIPAGTDALLTTHPYYASSYVLVYRKNAGYRLSGLDDPRLRRLKIGIHLMGEGTPPPALALARRGLSANIVGYSIYGDYSQPNPPARLIEAVADGDVDAALAWGPLAGYFAGQSSVPLEVVPLKADRNGDLPFRFDIAMGIARGRDDLRRELDRVLTQKRDQVASILAQYRVPLVRPTISASEAKELP